MKPTTEELEAIEQRLWQETKALKEPYTAKEKEWLDAYRARNKSKEADALREELKAELRAELAAETGGK